MILIPVHKPDITTEESKSLLQCNKILNDTDKFLVYPAGMAIEAYTQLIPGLILQPVASSWLCSLQAYNKMKCDHAFYKLFSNYNFMLTYETDAYVFSDEWSKANVFKYDYIGAPWFEKYGESGKFKNGGNSGFSMRNITACLKVLEIRKDLKIKWNKMNELKLPSFVKSLIFTGRIAFNSSLNLFADNYYYSRFFSEDPISEDIFWSTVVPKVFPFKTASSQDAVRFSFEKNPALLYKMNNDTLPLGCHAWAKYDPGFWNRFIR